MGRRRFLRVEMAALLTLTVLLQGGILVECHSPQPSPDVLGFLLVTSIVSFTLFMIARGSLNRANRIAYR
jgi:hypothetical protein